jgi:hypothetical protein
MEIAFLWFAFAVVVGVAAGSRGRNPVGWFVLTLFISPLIAFPLVLVMRREETGTAPNLNTQPFEPDGIHAGFPYRVMRDGSINAVIQGATVRFVDHAKFSAATGTPLLRAVTPPTSLRDSPPLPQQKLLTLVNIKSPADQKSLAERAGAEFARDGWTLLIVLVVGAVVPFLLVFNS